VKTAIFAIILSLAAGSVYGEETKKETTPAHPPVNGVLNQIIMPAVKETVKISTTAVFDALLVANAAEWALWDLMADLNAKSEAGEKQVPDKTLAETWLRLRMRCNTGDLVWKGVYSNKARFYPENKDFEAAAAEARAAISVYFSSLKPRKSPPRADRKARVEKSLETARKKMIFRLIYGPDDYSPKPPPPSPGETSYLEKAENSKADGKYAFPSW